MVYKIDTNYYTNLKTNYYKFTELQKDLKSELPIFKEIYKKGNQSLLIYKCVKYTLKVD